MIVARGPGRRDLSGSDGVTMFRGTGAVCLAAGAVLLALAGCRPAADAAIENTLSPHQETLADAASCQKPENVWTGRMAWRTNSQIGQGGGAGRSLVACFPTQQLCERWLWVAIGGARGVVVQDTCAQETPRRGFF